MYMSDWLEEIPVIGEFIILLRPEDASEDVPEGAPEDASEDAAELVTSATAIGDYGDLRETMCWIEVGDTGLDTRDYLLEKYSEVPVTRDATGNIISGQWTGPHGFTSTDPSNFDIDHRVPFSQVVEENPDIYNLSREEQLKIYNDPDNLQIVDSHHNQVEKGAETIQEHAPEFHSLEKREAFLNKGTEYLAKVKKQINSKIT